jgi:hypothetical protein
MVYNTHNHWVYGLCPSFGIINTRKHNFSQTVSLAVFKWGGGETPTLFHPLEKAIEFSHFKGTQQVRCLPSRLKTKTDKVSETSCLLVI